MTPWGIRAKIKGALGRGPTAPREDERFSLTFVLPNGSEYGVKCESRYSLVMASQMLETPIATGCPDGHCGGCAVDVIDGSGLAEPAATEAKLLTEKCKPNQRLACHARVIGNGAKVKVLTVWTMDDIKGT